MAKEKRKSGVKMVKEMREGNKNNIVLIMLRKRRKKDENNDINKLKISEKDYF